MRIWITRAQPEAEATAERIAALRHAPVVAPVLQVQAADEGPSLEGVGALAFTSRNGVRAFAGLTPERDLPVFAVGDATALAAREAGFAEVTSASGDVAALARLIVARKTSLRGDVLYASPEDPAGDLAATLAAGGVPARVAVVYRTVPAELAPPADAEVVLIHSAKAARRLADDPAVRKVAPAMTAICISAAAAEPLHGIGFREILIAARADEASMLELFQAWAARQPGPRLYTPLFWVVIAFALACIVAAILVAGLGPRLFPPRRSAVPPADSAAASIPRKIGLRPPSERAALAQPVERRIRNA